MAAMAVKDESLHHATEDLILQKPRKYYHALIHNSHWQLRSLISSPEQHTLYYPSGTDIIALNTKTHEREIITTLSFPPRCLTASRDWICIGGEQAEYVAIPLSDKKTSSLPPSLDADADARPPLDLDPSHRSTPRESSSSMRLSRIHKWPVVATIIKVGTEIINCITLWSPGEDPSDGAYKMPVAVVSNNDCSVSILDLQNSEVLQKLTLPDYVNRSVISPDGGLLATVSDDPFLYIHERRLKEQTKAERLDSKTQVYEWTLLGRIQLEGQRTADKSQWRGSFALCFSRSGKYLAAATQYGVISIFDVESLKQAESLMAVYTSFTSSRPGHDSGAVRAMEFSPGPFDLLAWTENSGRVGVADVRNLCLSRQLIIIDHNADGVERVIVSERPGVTPIDPRLRSFRTESPSLSSSTNSTTPDYLGLDLERRQLRHLTREILDRHQAPLTPEELEVLQAHRIARRQRDAANAAREALAEATRRNDESPDPRQSGSFALPQALRDFVNPDRNTSSFRSFIEERNQDRQRRTQPQQEPRRRSSMILAAAENAIERESLGPSSSRNVTGSDSPNNPWAEIDALYRSRFPDDPPLDRSSRLRIELEDDDRRDFAHRLRQPWRPLSELSQITNRLRPGSNETMGCTWSEDGRILYIGAENGIHEYHVNAAGRKMFPSLVLR